MGIDQWCSLIGDPMSWINGESSRALLGELVSWTTLRLWGRCLCRFQTSCLEITSCGASAAGH